ncbi:MAG: 4,5-DOPA dioxygenase extradiol [Ignavibacteriaceae bacterium]|nr:4,5-DOPA dioxygenase extradiol [Ignavibacteriaceae bacterium]
MNSEITKTAKMPVLFIGHGNPMNAIYDNLFTQTLSSYGKELGNLSPSAVLVISAHWLSKGTYVSTILTPPTIHDFSGFPDELFQVQYPAPGSPALALETKKLITSINVEEDNKFGLDHGAWSILKHLFPLADIPVYQLSIDYKKSPQWHFDLARELKPLREKGVLIIGSGNIVHNLYMVDFSNSAKPFPWAVEFDELVKIRLLDKKYESLTDYKDIGNSYLAVPSNDHYLPMMYTLGLADKDEPLQFIYEEIQNATISMRSFRIGN